MRRWFKSARTYVFVAPVAVVMADDGGCTSTSQQALTEEQVTAALVGNTVQVVDTGDYAFIDSDGTIRAKISGEDAVKTDVGSWTLDETGNFCVEWQTTQQVEDNCAVFTALDEDGSYQWGGHTFAVEAGNTKNL